MEYSNFDEELKAQDLEKNRLLKRELRNRSRDKKKLLKLQREIDRNVKSIYNSQ